MRSFVLLSLIISKFIHFSMSCRPEGYWHKPAQQDQGKNTGDKYFSSGNSWGGWSPPKGNDEWKKWIEKWGKHRSTDRPESGEWDSERGPGSGWPQHWRGYGLGIGGVPPPPWAYVPQSYDKPQYCFHLPRFGHCSDNVTRWGFNPTRQQCQTFFYSGCGGNDNNFISKASCVAACVDTAATDCEDEPAVNFEEMINKDYKEMINKDNEEIMNKDLNSTEKN